MEGPIFIENANGRGTGFGYDSFGRLSDIYEGARILNVDPDGNVTFDFTQFHRHMDYDANGRLTQITFANGDTVNYVYDDAGHVTIVRDGLGHEIQTTYLQRNGVTTDLVSPVEDALRAYPDIKIREKNPIPDIREVSDEQKKTKKKKK
jgi:YD repeat-containing protein